MDVSPVVYVYIYIYIYISGLQIREPDQPRAGQISCRLVRFFIGWSDFTCACARFSEFCRFIGLSDFSLFEGLNKERCNSVGKINVRD